MWNLLSYTFSYIQVLTKTFWQGLIQFFDIWFIILDYVNSEAYSVYLKMIPFVVNIQIEASEWHLISATF